MEICLVGTALMHADGRTDGWTDMTNLIGSFRDFTKNLSRKAWNCKLWQFKEIFPDIFAHGLEILNQINDETQKVSVPTQNTI